MMKLADIRKLLFLLPLAVILNLSNIHETQAQGQMSIANSVLSLMTPSSEETPETKTDEYYKNNNLTASQVDPEILALLDESKFGYFGDGKNKIKRIKKNLEKLAEYTGREGADKFTSRENNIGIFSTTGIEYIKTALKELVQDQLLTKNQADAIAYHATELYQQGRENADKAAAYAGDQNLSQQIQNYSERMEKQVLTNDCPTIDLIRAKYQSGCWSCLVVEKLSSAFMTAASKAYSLSQKAGLILLGLGSILWILVWGLRNVSSLTQLEPGNILNELIKFGFKVALAYIFIILGLRMVSTYFINPIMGLGAKIAETYWDKEKIKPYTQDYVWDDIDEAAIAKEEKAAIAAQSNTAQTPVTPTLEYSAEQQALIDAQKEVDKKAEPQEIPTFLVPGTNTGHLTSPVGCRIRPKVNCTGSSSQYKSGGNCYGSASHMGLDIGTSGKEGGVVFAMAAGKITYWGGLKSSAGYAATIQTKDKKGNIWTHRYLHMQPRAHSDFKFPSGEVATGQQIGYIGNTGGSSGAHLHIEIRFTGTWDGKKYNDVPLDPLRLVKGTFYPLYASQCNGSNVATFPEGFKSGQGVPAKGWPTSDKAVFDLSATYVTGSRFGGGMASYNSLVVPISPDITYTGPTDIMSKAVMNSILGATKAIGDITSENMILGDAVMCYATLDNGGAWHAFKITITNFWMWAEGLFIWCTGMLLTIAIAYYLLDLSFKIGFAVVALPIVVGLWPFEITRDKVAICISIIAKAAATFAFLAITTTFTVQLTDAVYSYGDDDAATQAGAPEDANGPKGLAKLYEIYDRAALDDSGEAKLTEAQKDTDMQYAASKLAIFSTTFVLLLFAFLYSFKLVQATVPDLVNKFFPDKAFGNQQPMHHWATAASRWVKDQAMKPVGFARDVALYQGGRLAKNAVGKTVGGAVGMAKKLAGKGKNEAKTSGGTTTGQNKEGGGK